MKLLLDTHIWIRWLSSAQPLPAGLATALESGFQLGSFDEHFKQYDCIKDVLMS